MISTSSVDVKKGRIYMSINISAVETVNALKAIFIKHQSERICVIGTTCCGKTTLLQKIPNCVDMDDVLGALLTPEESAYICQTPWTEEIGEFYDKLIYEKVKVVPGNPMFGTVIVDCEVVVYLDINDDVLMEHCEKRNVDFVSAKNMKEAIEEDWNHHRKQGGKIFYYLIINE